MPIADPKIDDEIMSLAKARISEEDREICDRLIRQGELSRPSTQREYKAIAAYLYAIDLECRRAGYRSFDEFQVSYCRGPSRTPKRYR